MIKKQAIEEFLNRDLQNYDWIKDIEVEELDNAIEELGFKTELRLTMRTHQKAAFYICACTDNFILHLDMGLGKTVISLLLFEFHKKFSGAKKMLTVVPNTVNIKNWEEQIKEFTDFKPVMLYGTASQRLDLLRSEGDIYIINYEGLPVLTTSLQKTGKSKKRKKIYDPELANEFVNSFDMIVLDEIHKTKNRKSLTYEICNEICKRTELRYGLTGTPLGRNPIDLWSQFHLIDRGETLGTSITKYTQAFFNSKPGYFGGMDYILDKKKEPILQNFIKNKSIYYADKECGDLPEQIFINRHVSMSKEAVKELAVAKAKAKELSIEREIGSTKETMNLYNRARQICSGFVYEKVSDDAKDKIAIRFPNNEKLDELEEILEQVPDGNQALVFYHFEESGNMIKDRLTKLKVKHVFCKGKSMVNDYERFKQDKKIKVLVINIDSGSTGLNLQNASYCIYYEPIDNPITYKQSLKRIHRDGQKAERVYYYYLLVASSVEEHIYGFLKEGLDMSKKMLEGNKSLEDFL